MKFASHPTIRAAGIILFAVAALALASIVPAFASDHQTSENNKTINQNDHEQRGETSGDGDAVAGKASATSRAIVVQRNVQSDGGNDNVTQHATNDATINQDTSAESGNAHADEGGSAKSGNAKATSVSVVTQINVQVVAGRCEDEVHQHASNEANVDQETSAKSGDAHAEAGGSAKSGDANATNVTHVHQRNTQVHKCKP